MPNETTPELDQALAQADAVQLARHASAEELGRLKVAEELLHLQHQRKSRTTRILSYSQALIGFVAVAGFFVNAYQAYLNKQEGKQHEAEDERRWTQEFERAKQADKYRAFFETSALVTDSSNPDKRLVGYALLQEFVDDKDYNTKATLLLEEALVQELRRNADPGLDEAHRNAVVAILSAISQTSDCHALANASKAIDKVARRKASTHDAVEAQEVTKAFVRRILGRAALACTSAAEFRTVRRPLQEAVMRTPDLVGLPQAAVDAPTANQRLAELLRDECQAEAAVSGASDCPDLLHRYAAELCQPDPRLKPAEAQAEQGACQVLSAAASASASPDAGVGLAQGTAH